MAGRGTKPVSSPANLTKLMVSMITFLFVLGVLIIVHEFGHFIAAKKAGVKVEKFSLGFGPVIFCRKKKETEYCINAIPLGGYVKLAGDSLEDYKNSPEEYLSKTPFARAKIIFAGSFFNYILGFLCFWLIFFAGYPSFTTKIGSLLEGFGAKEAGIHVGDRIISIDAKPVNNWEELQELIYSKQIGSTAKVSVLRDGKEYVFGVKIKERQAAEKHKVGAIGIIPAEETVKVRRGVVESFFLSAKKTWQLTAMTYKALWYMVTGKLSMRESVTGPLGIFYITSKAAALGITAVLNLLAILSVSLAIFNLLPLPVLDGGHIVLLFIEKIRGRALGLKVERIIAQIGVSFIVGLALFVTYNDILNFFGDKISKFFGR